MQRIRKRKDHVPGFHSLFLLYNIQLFHSTKNAITFKIFTTYNIKLCKILIKSKSLFLEFIREKLCNLLTFIGIASQVHTQTIQYSAEMEVCCSVARGLRPSSTHVWKLDVSDTPFNCLVVFLQYSKQGIPKEPPDQKQHFRERSEMFIQLFIITCTINF